MSSRPPLERMMRIRSILLGGGKFTIPALATDLEVTEKTLYRDIDFMRDRLGYNIYCYRDPNSTAFLWAGEVPIEPVL